MKRLKGQAAWISGATSGIGEAVARLFAREGAAVAIVGIDRGRGTRLAAELRTQGADAFYDHCNVTREAAVRASVRRTVARVGRLDILVNNAGITDVRPFLQYTSRQWDRVMDTNVKSMFYAAKHALPHLRRHGRGYLVNIGSISSFVAQALTPVYTVSKHAVLGLTRSLALDFAADGVRCNCVCPGITDTPMLRDYLNRTDDPEGVLARRLKRVPMGIPLSPHHIALAVLHLSCEASAGVTGTSVIVDGGYLTAAEWNCPGSTAFATRTGRASGAVA